MPKPVDHTWPAGMVMPVPVAVPVDVTGRARLRMAHEPRMREGPGCSTLTTTT